MDFQIGQLWKLTFPGVCSLADCLAGASRYDCCLYSSSHHLPPALGAMESSSGSPTTAWLDSSACENSSAWVLTCLIFSSGQLPHPTSSLASSTVLHQQPIISMSRVPPDTSQLRILSQKNNLQSLGRDWFTRTPGR